MRKLLLIVLFLNALNVYAQNGCDGLRYRSLVFNDVDTTFAIKFGENTTPGGATLELFMDIYEPQGDTLSDRPVIIWAFGGSFVGGDRTQLAELCHIAARRGFVAVAIDYRIYDGAFFPFPDSLDFMDVAVKAMGDMKAAIRKLREDAANGNAYRIDPNFIVAGGVSAGAITACHTAMLDSTDVIPADVLTIIANNGGFEGNSSSNYQYSSEVQATLNFSGALLRSSFIDANDPPLFSVHDDGDNIVPYGQGFASFDLGFIQINIVYVEGSSPIQVDANNQGITNGLITIPNSSGHVSYINSSSAFQDSVFTSSHLFLHNLICGIQLNNESIATPAATAFPNPSSGDVVLRLSELPASFNLVLYDQLGREVYRENNINEKEVIIARQGLPAGIYFLNMQFDDSKLPLVQQKLIFR